MIKGIDVIEFTHDELPYILKVIRTIAGLTQQELAEQSYTFQHRLSLYECGEDRPTDSELLDICLNCGYNLTFKLTKMKVTPKPVALGVRIKRSAQASGVRFPDEATLPARFGEKE